MSDRSRLAGSVLSGAVAVAALWAPFRAGAQERDEPVPPTYEEALAHLEAGDTATALARLREVVREAPDFGPGYLRLGALLAETAPEVERDFARRREAQRLLDRALELMADDPEAFLEYGLLLKKQHVSTDALRVLDRAAEAARRSGEAMTPRNRARLHFGMAKVYERWWEDGQHAALIPETVEPVRCFRGNRGTLANRAVACPEDFWVMLEKVVPIEDTRGEDRARMMEHLRSALESDPGHVEAAVHLLGHLADAGEWEAYLGRARALVERTPADPRGWLFLGLGLHHRGREDEAEGAFRRGLDLLPEEEKAPYMDVRPLLTEEALEDMDDLSSREWAAAADLLFRTRDPLFLTGANERRLEHWSRVAWADLKFSAPASGLRGWETDRGRVWIRYGEPARYLRWGRQMFWSYGPEGPVFAFHDHLTYRKTRVTDLTFELLEELESTTPEHYRPRTVTTLHPIPHQLARFRGERPGLTRVEIWARPPLDSLAVAEGAPLEAGIFVFDEAWRPVWRRTHGAIAGPEGLLLTYRFQVPEGRYRYGVEARLDAPPDLARPAARVRGGVDSPGYPAGALAVSDVLLAEEIRPRTDAPVRREELDLVPSRTLGFPPGEPVHLYFEVYGLALDGDGLGSYRAELAVEDSTRQNLVERVISSWFPDALRPPDGEARVTWERTVRPVEDRALDFLELDLPELDEGRYAVRIRITDLATGESTETVRMFWVGEPPRQGPEPFRGAPLGN